MAERSYPPWICEPCGRRYGRADASHGASFHLPVADDPRDACGWCGSRSAALTEPRDYGSPAALH